MVGQKTERPRKKHVFLGGGGRNRHDNVNRFGIGEFEYFL